MLEHHLSGGAICGWKTLTRWELWSEVSSTGCSSMRSERVDRSIDMKAQEPVPTRDTQSTPATRTLDSISPEVPGAGVENTLQQDTAHIVLEGESSTHTPPREVDPVHVIVRSGDVSHGDGAMRSKASKAQQQAIQRGGNEQGELRDMVGLLSKSGH